MVKNLPPSKIYDFIKNDFEGAWDSLAKNSAHNIGRGNFMFARQAMNLLEFSARLCTSDKSGSALKDLSAQLLKIEPKYFTLLPAPGPSSKEFVLPHNGNVTGNLLLWSLYDLVRHGLAHQ